MFKIGDKVRAQTKYHGWKPGIIVEKVEDHWGTSWEVKHLLGHWTKTTIAVEQDLELINNG